MKNLDDARLQRLKARVARYEAARVGGEALCTRCQKTKPATEFYDLIASPRCMECQKSTSLAYFRKNREIVLAKQRAKRKASRPQGQKARGRQLDGE